MLEKTEEAIMNDNPDIQVTLGKRHRTKTNKAKNTTTKDSKYYTKNFNILCHNFI